MLDGNLVVIKGNEIFYSTGEIIITLNNDDDNLKS